ncbi:hypothetical protein [Mucilaginibacter sp. PAMB04168]|uniref:hypothetical protein n=1 Tax=Mucilaginibacter sp. PAMB04168 TaxID=3138567 RepID=UPI0031F6AD5F
MSNTFSFKRFIMLFKKHTLEHGKTYLLSSAVLAGLFFISLGFISYINHGDLQPGAQGVIFVIFLLFAGSIFTSLIFAELGDKKKAVPVLTLPASHLEKYLIGWVYSFIIYQLVYIGLFYAVDGIVLSISNTSPSGKLQLVDLFDDNSKFYYVFTIYALFNALTLCGAIWFEKLHFIKTAFLFFIFVLVLTLINQPVLRAIIGRDIFKGVLFENLRFDDGGHYRSIEPGFDAPVVHFIITMLISVLVWGCAYFKLREKEV